MCIIFAVNFELLQGEEVGRTLKFEVGDFFFFLIEFSRENELGFPREDVEDDGLYTLVRYFV